MRAGQFLSIFAIVRVPQNTMRTISGMQASYPEILVRWTGREKFAISITSSMRKVKIHGQKTIERDFGDAESNLFFFLLLSSTIFVSLKNLK